MNKVVFEEGMVARFRRVLKEDNPYKGDQATMWQRGWTRVEAYYKLGWLW